MGAGLAPPRSPPFTFRLTASPVRVINGGMIETFLILLAAGSVLVWAALDLQAVGARFFQFQTLVLLAIVLAGGAVWTLWGPRDAWSDATWWVPLIALAGGWGALLAIRITATGGRARATAYLSAGGGLALLAGALMMLTDNAANWPARPTLLVPGLLLGALLLGITLQGMLLGHTYLTASQMPIRVLTGACRLLLAVAGLRTLLAIVLGALWWSNAAAWPTAARPRPGEIEMFAWIVLLMRVLFGLASPLLFGWMALASAKIRSTQSATGILYPTLVLVSVGELCFLYALRTWNLAI